MNIRTTRIVSGLLLGLLCGVLAPMPAHAAGQSNDDYIIDRDVINAGGGLSQSSAYSNIGSLGQTSPLGSSSNALHVVYAGFWHGKSFTLSIAKSGTGSGTVKDCVSIDNCPGTRINCGTDCSDFYAENSSLLLQAFPDPGSEFCGWFLDGLPITEPLYILKDLVVTACFDSSQADSDTDGLTDGWEAQIIQADPNDSIIDLEGVNPNDDFDGDGLTNLEEFLNETDPTTLTEVVATMAASVAEAQQLETFKIDLQLRIRSDNRPAKLVRDVGLMVDGGGRFGSQQSGYPGSITASNVFPGRITAKTNVDGQFAVDVSGIQKGQVAFHVENISGGGGVVPPASDSMTAVQAPFLTSVWTGRQLAFPAGQDAIQIRIHDFAAVMYNFANSADQTWQLGGISFDYVTISKYGYLLLGQQSELSSTTIDWQTAPNGVLASFADQLIMKPESRVYINWDWSTEPYFIVEWSRMGHASDPDARLTFQVQIWQRSQQVRFVYHTLFDHTGQPANWPTATAGIKYDASHIFVGTQSPTSFSALEVVDPITPVVRIWELDADQDYLLKAEEEALGTDPDYWDSDFDGMSDGWEQTFSAGGLNPLAADSDADPDGDGYTNIIEYYLGSKPDTVNSPQYCEPDTDHDGMPNRWEVLYGLDPNSADDALADTDHDRYVNILEYAIGGDPTDAANHGYHPAEPEGGSSNVTYP